MTDTEGQRAIETTADFCKRVGAVCEAFTRPEHALGFAHEARTALPEALERLAELDAVRMDLIETHGKLKDERDRLRAEVEQLTKAMLADAPPAIRRRHGLD